MQQAWGDTTPSLARFRELAAEHRRVIPVTRRLLADTYTPVGVYRQLANGRPGTFILESAEQGEWSRWSFIGVASQATLVARDGQARWIGDIPVGIPRQGPLLEVLEATLAELRTEPLPGLPPLTGGLVGALGWDVVHQWYPGIPVTAPDELGMPDAAMCLATDLAAIDHRDGSVWLIANAINFDNTDDRVDEAYADAVRRLDTMQRALVAPSRGEILVPASGGSPSTDEGLRFRSPQASFEASVEAAQAAIARGEIVQLVLSQRLDLDCPAAPVEVYRALRTINPSPYMYYLQLPDDPAVNDQSFAVVGGSPETLVKVSGDTVMTFPIAGSRPRGGDPEEDEQLVAELLADPKERAEHVMLVDLSRDDLHAVCEPDTIAVRDFMSVKRYSHISHICSTVTGRLRAGATALDCLGATFPAGTLSGAPKARSVALIDELEPARRGIYGGTIGYFDFAGNTDMAIAIRTACIRDGVASVQAGAGIVAESVPATEYVETRNKAAAAVRAVQVAAATTVINGAPPTEPSDPPTKPS